jgi:hypothetical protein
MLDYFLCTVFLSWHSDLLIEAQIITFNLDQFYPVRSELPLATGPVGGSRGQKLQSLVRAKTLSSWNSGWDSNKSGPACQTGEMIMRMLSDASQPDKILCYVGALEAAGLFNASYDGTNKYYILSNMGNPEGRTGDMTIKFNIGSTNGAITNFKMWMCQTSKRGRETEQTEYVSTSISNGTATVTSVGTHSGAEGGNTYSGSQRTVASGTFNSSNEWTSKVISNTAVFSGSFSGQSSQHKQQLTLTQGADHFILNGYFSGHHNGAANTQSGSLYSKVEGVDLSNLSTAALGDGSAKFSFLYNGTQHEATKSWNGLDQTPLNPPDSGVYYSTVSSATLPTSEQITTPTFQQVEAWNCDTTGETVTTINMSSAMTLIQSAIGVCNTKFNFNNNNPVGCSVADFTSR